jgi:hypothetical protein
MTRVFTGDAIHVSQDLDGTKGDIVSMSDGSRYEIDGAGDDGARRLSLLLHEVLEIVCEATDDLLASTLHGIGEGIVTRGLLVSIDGETRASRSGSRGDDTNRIAGIDQFPIQGDDVLHFLGT